MDLPGCKTLGDTVGFCYMHNCYHLGELGSAHYAAGLKGAIR